MGVTLFSDGTNQYYRITKRWGDKDHQYYVRVGKNKDRALKEALAIEARLEQAARAHASVKDLTGENYIHHDGSIVGVALGFRQRDGRMPNIEFKVRVAARGKSVRFSTVSLNKYDFDEAFKKVVETVADLRDVEVGSEAYSRLLATRSFYFGEYNAMNKELRGISKSAKKPSAKARAEAAKPARGTKSNAAAKKKVATAKPASVKKISTKKVKSPAEEKQKASEPKKTLKPAVKTKAQTPKKVASVPSAKKVSSKSVKPAKSASVEPKPAVTRAKTETTAAVSAQPKKAKRKQPSANKKSVVAGAPAVETVKPTAAETASQNSSNTERGNKSASTDDWEEMLSREVQRFMQRKGIVRG